jgi:hypothetical protein
MGAKNSVPQNNMNFRQGPSTVNQTNIPSTQQKVSLEEAYESLEDYKEAMNNVYCLNKLLIDYYDDIEEKRLQNDLNPINTILSTTLHDGYDRAQATNYCEIIELARNMNEVNGCRLLFSCKQYEEIDGMHLLHIKSKEGSEKIDDLTYSQLGKLLEMRIIDMSKRIPAYGNMYIYAGLGMWTSGIRCYFNILRRNPFDPEKWLMISSGVNMKNYTSQNIINLKTFSPEYKILMENITQVMNSNAYLAMIEDSAEESAKTAEEAIKDSEEKTALYNVHKKLYESAPTDPYAKVKFQDATMAAQSASRIANTAITNAKASQMALTEAEAHIAAKTTTWEYGTSEKHNQLRCIYSGVHPHWNGMLITDCVLRESNLDMPGITLSVMKDIEKNYVELFNNQMVLCSYKTSIGYYISIVKIIKRGEDVHIQMKEACLNNIFNERPRNIPKSDNSLPNEPRMVNNNVKSYVFIDPSTNFIGIGTNEQIIKYEDQYITTKNNNLQHVAIKSKYYPNLVNTRIAESNDSKPHKNYYFDQFSSSTMRRESNLYGFDEMLHRSEEASMELGEVQRYGSDISFEITDKTKTTCEIGSVGMVIDKIDQEDGCVYGGFSVKTVPNIEKHGDRDITKPGNTIMYVSSEGLLHIQGIMLGSKLLTVKHEGDKEMLYWGDKKIK